MVQLLTVGIVKPCAAYISASETASSSIHGGIMVNEVAKRSDPIEVKGVEKVFFKKSV